MLRSQTVAIVAAAAAAIAVAVRLSCACAGAGCRRHWYVVLVLSSCWSLPSSSSCWSSHGTANRAGVRVLPFVLALLIPFCMRKSG